MSIIYDALQKTQKNRITKSDIMTPKPRTNVLKIKLILMLTSALIVTTGFYFFSQFRHLSTSVTPIKKIVQIAKTTPPQPTVENNKQLSLQGIFSSDKNKMAMINNKMYQVGDTVDEMKIISITQKGVKLQKKNEVLTLSLGIN